MSGHEKMEIEVLCYNGHLSYLSPADLDYNDKTAVMKFVNSQTCPIRDCNSKIYSYDVQEREEHLPEQELQDKAIKVHEWMMEKDSPEQVCMMKSRMLEIRQCYNGCRKCLFPPRYFITLNGKQEYFCEKHGDFKTLEAVSDDGEVGEYLAEEIECIECDGRGLVDYGVGEGEATCVQCNGSGWMKNDKYQEVINVNRD